MGDIYVGAYWKARKESVQACADKLRRCLTELSLCGSIFSTWYKLGRSRKDATKEQIDFKNMDVLVQLLEGGRRRKDIGNEVIDDLGFGIGLWNGGTSGRDVGLSITCGLYSTVRGLGGNCVVIQLPKELGDLKQKGQMANVLLAVVRSWDPDWGGVISTKSRNARKRLPGMPVVDWMLYVSRAEVPKPQVPQPSTVISVDNIGSLIIVQEEPINPVDPAHLRNIRAVENALGFNQKSKGDASTAST